MREWLEQLIPRNEVYVGKWSLPWVSMSENHDAREATLDDTMVTSKEELIVAPQAYVGLPSFKIDKSYWCASRASDRPRALVFLPPQEGW